MRHRKAEKTRRYAHIVTISDHFAEIRASFTDAEIGCDKLRILRWGVAGFPSSESAHVNTLDRPIVAWAAVAV
jgi:hypothetical protein